MAKASQSGYVLIDSERIYLNVIHGGDLSMTFFTAPTDFNREKNISHILPLLSSHQIDCLKRKVEIFIHFKEKTQ